MNIIDLIINIVDTISNFLRNNFLINWLSNNILVGNIAIVIVILLAANGVQDLITDHFNLRIYPGVEKYGLTKITETNMDTVCTNKEYAKQELFKEYGLKNLTDSMIEYINVTDKPYGKREYFPAYQWVCQYKIQNNTDNSDSKSKSSTDVIKSSSIKEIGLSVDKYFCQTYRKPDRAIFLDYEDPQSWFCIKDEKK